jgi:hypothetical protein
MAKASGGLKGLIQRTGKVFYAAGLIARDYGTIAARLTYRYGGSIAFAVATTSMIVLLPLVLESTREGQVRALWLSIELPVLDQIVLSFSAHL